MLEIVLRQLRVGPGVLRRSPASRSECPRFLAGCQRRLLRTADLGEVYATLTGLPIHPRISGPEGIAVVKQIVARLTVISLTDQEYISTLETSASTIVGNTAYDALIARCAVKAGADVLLTWNIRHFLRLGADVALLVRTPAEL